MNRRTSHFILAVDLRQTRTTQCAQELADLSACRLTIRDLHNPEVRAWRETALGTDTPAVPTLFAIDGEQIDAWTKGALALRLGRLVGIRNMWHVTALLGEAADRSVGPSSPARRRIVQQGVTGVAAAAALLAMNANEPVLRVLAGTFDEELAADPGVDEDGGGLSGQGRDNPFPASWGRIVRRLSGNNADGMRTRARNDRHFTMIKEYFDERGIWNFRERKSVKVTTNKYWGSAHFEMFKREGEDKFAFVMYFRDERGRNWSRGYIWTRDRVTNEYHVTNGRVRDDSGPVSATAADEQDACGYNQATCFFGVAGGCGVVGGYAIVLCGVSVGLLCSGTQTVVAGCGLGGGGLYDWCVDFQTNGEGCP